MLVSKNETIPQFRDKYCLEFVGTSQQPSRSSSEGFLSENSSILTKIKSNYFIILIISAVLSHFHCFHSWPSRCARSGSLVRVQQCQAQDPRQPKSPGEWAGFFFAIVTTLGHVRPLGSLLPPSPPDCFFLYIQWTNQSAKTEFARVQTSVPYLLPQWLQNGYNRYPIYDQNGWKTIPFGAAHTYIAHIREYPPPPLGGYDHMRLSKRLQRVLQCNPPLESKYECPLGICNQCRQVVLGSHHLLCPWRQFYQCVTVASVLITRSEIEMGTGNKFINFNSVKKWYPQCILIASSTHPRPILVLERHVRVTGNSVSRLWG